jgi:hypothetical protein
MVSPMPFSCASSYCTGAALHCTSFGQVTNLTWGVGALGLWGFGGGLAGLEGEKAGPCTTGSTSCSGIASGSHPRQRGSVDGRWASAARPLRATVLAAIGRPLDSQRHHDDLQQPLRQSCNRSANM